MTSRMRAASMTPTLALAPSRKAKQSAANLFKTGRNTVRNTSWDHAARGSVSFAGFVKSSVSFAGLRPKEEGESARDKKLRQQLDYAWHLVNENDLKVSADAKHSLDTFSGATLESIAIQILLAIVFGLFAGSASAIMMFIERGTYQLWGAIADDVTGKDDGNWYNFSAK